MSTIYNEINWKKFNKSWTRSMRSMEEYFKQIAEVAQTWFPYEYNSSVDLIEASRVHRLYRRKQLARRKRNRRR